VKPYYQDDLTTLYRGDCLKVMAQLEAHSFDAVICDEPYGTTACAWDSPIPFDAMWSNLKRLAKPRGTIVLFGSQPFTSALVMSNPGMFKYSWVWDKRCVTGFLDANRKPMKRHEDILIFANERAVYNPIMRTGVFRNKGGAKRSDVYGRYERTSRHCNDQYYPTSIIEIHNSDQRAKLHPTQKPLDLMEYLVKTYTNEGDMILDFTCGSGSTLRAAKNLKRRSVGIELLEEYCQVTVKRLAPAFEEALVVDEVQGLGPLFAI
jgi:hypothetical protein